MKLCWEFLDKLRLTDRNMNGHGLLVTDKMTSTNLKVTQAWEYKELCDYCGKDYMGSIGSKTNYCDKEHRHLHFLWKKEWRQLQKQNYKRNYPRRYHKKHVHTEETLKKMSNMMKERWQTDKAFRENIKDGKDNHMWSGGEWASYDKYTDKLNWYFNVRRDPNDADLLQVKCAYCEKWHRPKHLKVISVIHTIYGRYGAGNKKNGEWLFYCQHECTRKLYKYLSNLKKLHKKKLKIEKCIKCQQQKRLLRNKKKWGIFHRKEYRKIIKKFKLLKKQREKGGERKRKFKIVQKWREEHPEDYRKQIAQDVMQRRNKLKENDPKKFKLKKLFYYSKVRAKEKKLEHTLTYSWLEEKCKNNICEATGKTFDYDPDYHRNPYGPSIDRTDISKGYTENNCRIVIWAYNCGKAHYTDKDLYKMCTAFIKQHDYDVLPDK